MDAVIHWICSVHYKNGPVREERNRPMPPTLNTPLDVDEIVVAMDHGQWVVGNKM